MPGGDSESRSGVVLPLLIRRVGIVLAAVIANRRGISDERVHESSH
jgi:hypothetical protein